MAQLQQAPRPRPSPAHQQVPGAETRSRPHAFPQAGPTSPTKSRDGVAGRPSWEQPPILQVQLRAGQGRGMVELTTHTPRPASTPALATPLHPTLPAARSPRRMGGTRLRKGEHRPLRMGLPPTRQ